MAAKCYRQPALPAVLVRWNMAQQAGRSSIRQRCIRRLWLFSKYAVIAAVVACKPPKAAEQKPDPTPAGSENLASRLAIAQTDAAAVKHRENRPDEALSLLVSALQTAPDSAAGYALAETILKQTRWNLPDLSIQHPLPVEHLSFKPPSSLWVGIGPATNSTVRWNLETLEIESILFPRKDCETRSLVFDQKQEFLVIERGGVTLLCNARTLKPICDLGNLPADLTPSAVIVFSEDGLLMGHPAQVSETDRAIIWHLRDTRSGQIIRSSEPVSASAPQPLAAHLDRQRLQVLLKNGTLQEIPVSPVEPVISTPLDEPAHLIHAQFSADGMAILTLKDQGPHQDPVLSILSSGDKDDGSLKMNAIAGRFPWNLKPNIWNSLLRGNQQTSFLIDQATLSFTSATQAPVITASPITAAFFDHTGVFSGQEDGTVTFHRFLPLPLPKQNPPASAKAAIFPDQLEEFEKLVEALTALRYDESTRTFQRLTPSARRQAIENCKTGKIEAMFPSLDFAEVIKAIGNAADRAAGPHALKPLLERFEQSKPLAEPTLAAQELQETFRRGESSEVIAAIQAAGKSGPLAAQALALALKSENVPWIESCLNQAENLPALLRQISQSRIAWLQGRKADALAAWPEIFPELAFIRSREDWQGWEQVDFQPALDDIRNCVRGELDAIEVPKDSTPEQRRAIAARLMDRATLAAVGPRRFSEACLKAALAFSAFKEETQTTFQLANLARNMGAPPEPCLRAEALALTGSGDSVNAHPRWIELITEHPVATHLPGDYAEAAYTAFENSDPRQAMEILTTGMHRFPQDGNFALRAGWVALLTGNSERAYRFLREGQRIGFPAEKLENGTALLTIAASLTGATDDAAVYFQDLLRIDEAWADPATLDTLDWPEDLKSVLGQFTLGL